MSFSATSWASATAWTIRRAISCIRVSPRFSRMRSSASLRHMRCGDWSPAAPIQPSTQRFSPYCLRRAIRTSCQKSALTTERFSTSWAVQATLTAVATSRLSLSQKKRTSTPWSSGPSTPRKSGWSVWPYILAEPSA